MIRPLAFASAALVAACGPVDSSPPDAGLPDGATSVTLEVAPPSAVLIVRGDLQAEQTYSASARSSDGSTRNVTDETVFSLDRAALGAFDGATLRTTGLAAGHGTVTAVWQGKTAQVPVTVRLERQRVVDPAPAAAPGLFVTATEDAGRAPTVVYPADGTYFPPNVGDFEIHWTDAGANDLYEVRLASDLVDLRLYVAGSAAGGLWAAFLPAEWALVRESARGASLALSVRGLAAATPATAGTSPEVQVGLTEQDIKGGIYYWAAAGTPEGIYRHDFEKPGEPAEVYYTTAQTSDRCVACHVLSRDGTRMAVTFDGGDGAGGIIDVATRAPLSPVDGTFHWNFAAFEPTGDRLVTASHGVLTVRDPATGAEQGTVTTPGYATQLDFSPNGDAIAYALAATASYDWVFSGGSIVVQPFDPGAGTFGSAVTLVAPAAENQYYPAFSPDGEWIAFNRSTGDSYDDADAQIWMIRADGSAAPFLLASPNQASGLTNSWVRWAPFAQVLHPDTDLAEPLFWMTFSSKRAFGVRMAAGRPQVWMAPFFPARAAAGEDASAPAFHLPFQNLETSNHIAQWTTAVVPVE